MEACLIRIAHILNANNVVWALGASMLLHYKGLVEQPNDIDILVSIDDAAFADKLLQNIGQKHPLNPNENYLTKYFYEYRIDGIDVDLMSGFTIKLEDGAFYEYVLNEYHLEFMALDNTTIPLSPLEDWLVLYMLMPGRQAKVQLIEEHLNKNSIQIEVVKARLQDRLPGSVKHKLMQLLPGKNNIHKGQS